MESKQFFFGVMGAPYESDLTTSLFRMVAETLEQGHRATVWACGGSTTLTLTTLDRVKPANLLDLAFSRGDILYPTTAAMVRALLESGAGRLAWMICRHCMEERGAIDQMPEVKVQAPFQFRALMDRADVALILGVK
jgi:sulfur relay (sulfurtransferase) complex TusBCD TusD component (DsrE family)